MNVITTFHVYTIEIEKKTYIYIYITKPPSSIFVG